MITLKSAQQSGDFAQFTAEREESPPGDMDAFARCLTSMAGTKKVEPVASTREPSDD